MATLPTRADTLTGTKKQLEFFSDFNNNFTKTPYGNQLARVTNVEAINQSLRNLIKTNLGERPFQPFVGSDIYASLFENNNSDYMDLIEMFVTNTINNNEPRVKLISVTVGQETGFNENEVQINIEYYIINNPDPVNLTVILKRVR
jgi:phage baseplate assembly protein W